MTNYNIPAKVHRQNAKKALGGKIFGQAWMTALVVTLLYTIIISVASTITAGIATIFLSGPLLAGLYLYFVAVIRNQPAKLEDLFGGFKKDFLGNFLIALMITIFTFLWTLLLVIPGIVKAYAYSMAFYIHNDHPEYTWKQSIEESQKMMKGKKWKLFCLDLSFIGWILVGFITFGIGLLWVEPYYYAAHASFYESIVAAPACEEAEAPAEAVAE